jgi:hypothetical protein
MATKSKSKFLTVRVSPDDHKKFHNRVKSFGQPSEILREIIQAFIEDRLTIQPPAKTKESLYVPRIEN